MKNATADGPDVGRVVAENIARALQERKWDYERLAEASGVGLSDLISWRAHAGTMGVDALWRVACGLGVQTSDLVATK